MEEILAVDVKQDAESGRLTLVARGVSINHEGLVVAGPRSRPSDGIGIEIKSREAKRSGGLPKKVVWATRLFGLRAGGASESIGSIEDDKATTAVEAFDGFAKFAGRSGAMGFDKAKLERIGAVLGRMRDEWLGPKEGDGAAASGGAGSNDAKPAADKKAAPKKVAKPKK